VSQRVAISLRPVLPRDHAALTSLRSDVDLQRKLLGARDPIEEPVSDWLDRRGAEGWVRSVVDSSDNCLGYVQLSDIHHNNRTGWFGICLVSGARGHGCGMAAIVRTLGAARDELGLRKISLKVRADNPAYRLYQKVGFQLVGTQRAEYDDGVIFHDVKIMELLFGEHAEE